MASPAQETFWVLRAQTGDREALDELLKTVQEPLFRYLVSLVGETHLAEDILQEVFIRIYRKLRWLREPKLFRPWAYRLATREAYRHLRRERKWADQVRDEGLLESIPAPPLEELPPDLAASLPRLIAGVSSASRAVIVLHYLHEMTLEEVAAVNGIPLGTVKSRLAYGLRGLRQQYRSQARTCDRRP